MTFAIDSSEKSDRQTRPGSPNDRPLNIVVVGAGGAIGSALVDYYLQHTLCTVFALSRKPVSQKQAHYLPLDVGCEDSIIRAAATLKSAPPFDCLLVATGVLHNGEMRPEKALSQLQVDHFMESLRINTLGPALVMKHLLPLLDKHSASRCGLLSARVGSLADNRLGGWYSYRCAKAALNMLIRTTAVELGRSHKQSTIVGLHPGTVDSNLSQPFQRNVAPEKLFTPDFSAGCLADVLHSKTKADSGQIFAWDNSPIPF